jgi:hypothetical protein
MAGPTGAWYAVGFNAEEMKDAPYAIVVDGDGKVSNGSKCSEESRSILVLTRLFHSLRLEPHHSLHLEPHHQVSERKLVDHGPGSVLTPSVTVASNTVVDGIRTIVLTRAVAGATTDHFTIPSSPGQINLITATGNTNSIAYHKARTGTQITLVPTKVSACVCKPEVHKYFLEHAIVNGTDKDIANMEYKVGVVTSLDPCSHSP